MIKHIINIYFGAFVWFNIAEFDTQDNIVRTTAGTWNWEQNLNLDTFEPLQEYGLQRIEGDRLRFKSKTKIKSIRLDQFKYPYKVKRLGNGEFIIESKYMSKYFDDTDIIRILVREK